MAVKEKLREVNGELLTLHQLERRYNLNEWTIRYRLRHGIDLNAPLRSNQGRPQAVVVVEGGFSMTYAQIAEAEGISIGAARQRVHKKTRVLRGGDQPETNRERAKRYRASIGGVELVDRNTPYERDDKCWYVTTCHPNGLTLEQIGTLINCTRERVRQIEASALRKLRRRGVSCEDIMRMKACGEQLEALRERKNANDNPTLGGVHYLVPPTALPNGRRRAS